MTQKYLYIRRAIYEENPASKLNSLRSFSQMIRLFRLPYWIMLGVLMLAIVLLVIIALIDYKNPFILLPAIAIVLVAILSQIPREKHMYNIPARVDELSEQMQFYEQYISDIWRILNNYGIDTSEKVMKLKTECEMTLKMHEDKFAKINTKIADMLISVPLGALIASIIYADNSAVPAAIGAIILIGLFIMGFVMILKSINYYSEGYFKDKYLLEALNELDYSGESLDQKNAQQHNK